MKKLSILLFLVAMTSSLTSCLKDGKVNFAPGASPMTIQWATAAIDDAPTNSASNIYRTYSRAYPILASVKMDLQIDLTGTDPATEDITISIGVKPSAVDEYNAKYAAGFTVLPTNTYTMPTSVVIPKGLRTATVSIVLNTTLFDLSKNYALPVSIISTTSGQVSANYGTVLYNVAGKNKYDGIFGFVSGPGSTLQPGKTASSAKLATVGANAVSTSLLQTYTNVTTFTFDPATNKLIAVDVTGLGSASSITADSGYDPATKIIKAFYVIGTRTFQETYTYKGVR